MTEQTIYILQVICRTDGSDQHRAFHKLENAAFAMARDIREWLPQYDGDEAARAALLKALEFPQEHAALSEAWSEYVGHREWLGIIPIEIEDEVAQ